MLSRSPVCDAQTTKKQTRLATKTVSRTSRTTRVIIVQEISDSADAETTSGSGLVTSPSPASSELRDSESEKNTGDRGNEESSTDVALCDFKLPAVGDATASSLEPVEASLDQILSAVSNGIHLPETLSSGSSSQTLPTTGKSPVDTGHVTKTRLQQTTTTKKSTCVEFVETSSQNFQEKSTTSGGGAVFSIPEEDEKSGCSPLKINDVSSSMTGAEIFESQMAEQKHPEVISDFGRVGLEKCGEEEEMREKTFRINTVSEIVQTQVLAQSASSDIGSPAVKQGLPDEASTSIGLAATASRTWLSSVRKNPSPAMKALSRSNFGRSRANLIAPGVSGSAGVSNVGGSSGRTLKMLQHPDELASIEESLMYKMLKPVIICMKFAGLYHERRTMASSSSCSPVNWIRNCSKQQFYCLFIIFVLLVNFIWSLTAFTGFDTFGSEMFFKLMISISFYEAVSRAVMSYKACRDKRHGLRELFLAVDDVFFPDRIVPYERSLARCVLVSMAAMLCVTIANVSVTAFSVFYDDSLFDYFNIYVGHLDAKANTSVGVIVFKIYWVAVTAANGIVASLSITFYNSVCYVFYKEFEYVKRTFARKVSEINSLNGTTAMIGQSQGRQSYCGEIERFRIIHQRRCKLVTMADQLFKYYIANTYLANVPLLCLLLMGVINYQSSNPSYQVLTIFRCCYVTFQMAVVTVIATMINTQAHAPLNDIYQIKIRYNEARHLEISMFLSKLTAIPIGLTACDMFIIDKPSVLVVVGVIASYFGLLLQLTVICSPKVQCLCDVVSENGTVDVVPGLLNS